MNVKAPPSLRFPSSSSSSSSSINLQLGIKYPQNKPTKLKFNFLVTGNQISSTLKSTSITDLKPYLQSQWRPILSGWLSSAVSVYSLSQIVPLTGNLSSLAASSPNFTTILKNQCLLLALLVFTRAVANYLQQAFLWEASFNCVYKVRAYVFQRVLHRDLGFFEGQHAVLPGDVAYRISAEAEDIADTVYSLLNTIVPCTLQLSAMATHMLSISPALSLMSALVIPPLVLLHGCLGEKLRMISNVAQHRTAALSAYLNEVLPSILFVKANNAESCECIKFKSLALADLSAYSKKKHMKVLIPHVVQLMFFGVLFVFGATSLVVSRGSFNCSAVVSFVTSLILLVEPIQGVGKAYNEFKQGEPAIERLFSLTKFKSQVAENPDAVDITIVSGEVNFSDLSFTYGDDRHPVLNGLNLHIRAGETVALVGPSGGGKTTLAKLLLRLYEPLCGCILIDGYDIRSIQLESLRRHVGLVSQDTVLFAGTIAENIGYRDIMTGIDMARVEFAARTANADEFITCLPDQYRTYVGPRGSSFSGGQRQRLAIARALYQNPSILILDEATSALDSRSELLVRQALQQIMQHRTVVIISHRLETVLMAERIFHLTDGKMQQLSRSDLLDGHHGLLESALLGHHRTQ